VELETLLLSAGALAVLLALTLGLQRWAGVGLGLQPLAAGVRAILQLTVIAVVLHGVFEEPWTAFLFLILMLTVASVTAARRIRELPLGTRAAPGAVVAGATITIGLVFALQLLPVTPSNVIAVGGIVTGNSMSAATLTGRRFMATSRAERAQIEGWLALGARPPQAFAEVSRTSIKEMLIPAIDQTKNTGLVTLPGAFVGAIMGGASPTVAAHFQLVVLIGVMLAQTIVGIIETRILSRSSVIVADAAGQGSGTSS